jgi:hypothetical protein
MMLMGIRATPDGTVEGVVVDVSESRLAGMRAQIGCDLVDVVALDDGIDMWVDDEGLYRSVPNPVATVMAPMLGYVTQRFHGTVLFLAVDDEGDTRSLSPEQHRRVMLAGQMAAHAIEHGVLVR